MKVRVLMMVTTGSLALAAVFAAATAHPAPSGNRLVNASANTTQGDITYYTAPADITYY